MSQKREHAVMCWRCGLHPTTRQPLTWTWNISGECSRHQPSVLPYPTPPGGTGAHVSPGSSVADTGLSRARGLGGDATRPASPPATERRQA